MSMITATAWVPRGFAATFPTRCMLDEDELARISKLAKLELEDAQADLAEAQKLNGDEITGVKGDNHVDEKVEKNSTLDVNEDGEDDELKEYDMDRYDEDEQEDGEVSNMGMFGNIGSLKFHNSNAEDPYITLPDDEDNEEREELQILNTDNLILTARIEDEVAHLEVYVYEDEADNLYVHHDIMLPAIPLSLEWLDFPVGRAQEEASTGNFVAVGTMDPDIEIWDLDIVDGMYPNAILGQGGESARKPEQQRAKKKKKSKRPNESFHVDAVLNLAANRLHRNLLASSSADRTIKLWDLNSTTCAKSYSYHTDKVCTLAWHPKESTILLSGSYDRGVVAADMRAPEAKPPRWAVESDVEIVKWDPHDTNYFYVSTENGIVRLYDARVIPTSATDSKPVWTLQAHNEPVSAFDVNPIIPGFLVTGSPDRDVKLWNVQASGPSMVVSRNLGVGKVFSTNFAPDQEVGFRLAVAGSKGSVQVWDTSTNTAVRRAFAHKTSADVAEVSERLVTVQQDDSDSGEEVPEAEGTHGHDRDGWESSE